MYKHLKFGFHTLCLSLIFISSATFAEQEYSGGQTLSDEEINNFSLTIYPDGRGLPAGSGNAIAGRTTYQTQCLACHGSNGTMGVAPRLVGKEGFPEGVSDLLKTLSVGAWPNATTIFDYIRRAMPHTAPKSLNDDEVYQLTAYILYLNDLIKEDQFIDKQTLPLIEMPNKKRAINMWDLDKTNQ